MNEDLDYLMRRCRDSAPQLTDKIVLEKCRAAAEQRGQARLRTTSYFRRKMKPQDEGGRAISWSDLRDAVLSATSAIWQEDHGRWRLTGGMDNDGIPLTIIVMVTSDDDVYAWNAFEPREP
jgi:hypothetical protein